MIGGIVTTRGMTYCDGENDDREVDPDGDNNTNCQELDQDYGTVLMAQH